MKNVKYLSIRPNLYVKDLTVSVDFYTKIMGLDILHVDEKLGFALLAKHGAEIALLKQKVFSPTGAYLYVNHVDDLYLHCKSLGIVFCNELTEHAHGTKDFVINDPDGNQIAIGERLASAS